MFEGRSCFQIGNMKKTLKSPIKLIFATRFDEENNFVTVTQRHVDRASAIRNSLISVNFASVCHLQSESQVIDFLHSSAAMCSLTFWKGIMKAVHRCVKSKENSLQSYRSTKMFCWLKVLMFIFPGSVNKRRKSVRKGTSAWYGTFLQYFSKKSLSTTISINWFCSTWARDLSLVSQNACHGSHRFLLV